MPLKNPGQTLPCINPYNTSFHVVHSEAVGPAAAARLPVDGASAFTAHGCCLYPGQTSIPVCPKQNSANRTFLKVMFFLPDVQTIT